MVSLIVHALLGILASWWIVQVQSDDLPPHADRAVAVRRLKRCCTPSASSRWCSAGISTSGSCSRTGHGKVFFNPIWGDGSWAQYIKLMFANPAASSAGQDYTIGNVVLLPLMTIVDGRRRGIARPWLYFVSTLFTSFAFGWAFYLATVERQRRVATSHTIDAQPA